MKLLTLTPDVRVYVVAAIAVCSLACGPTAVSLQALWPASRTPPFLPVYTVTMAAVAAVALAALSLPGVTQRAPGVLAPAVVAGLAAGVAASWCDSAVRRVLLRRAHGRRGAADAALLSRRAAGAQPSPPRGPATAAVSEAGLADLALLLVVALLEELLFRGVLVDLSLQLSSDLLAAVCVAGTVAAFAAAHAYWGWEELLAKVPLGVAALAASLPFHAVAGAVAAHALFNARAWLAARAAA